MNSETQGGFNLVKGFDDTVSVGGDSVNHLPNNYILQSSGNCATTCDNYLRVDITESKSEHEKVLFHIVTMSNLPNYKTESSVWRQYEEFLWLHNILAVCSTYDGLIIPPAPPKPEFETSRLKLNNFNSLENSLTRQELEKLKLELQNEYVASFKKTVAMHEIFIKRLAKHPKIQTDQNFIVFLQYKEPLSIRTKNTKEKAAYLFRNFTKNIDDFMNQTSKEESDIFFLEENIRLFLYYRYIKEAAINSEMVNYQRKIANQNLLKSHISFTDMSINFSKTRLLMQSKSEYKLNESINDFFDRMYRNQISCINDEELKLIDTIKYYQRETEAAKLVLYRRAKLISECENYSKLYEKAKERRKDAIIAETLFNMARDKLENMTSISKDELKCYLYDRIKYFEDNLKSFTKLQIENSKHCASFLKESLLLIRNILNNSDETYMDTFQK